VVTEELEGELGMERNAPVKHGVVNSVIMIDPES
jgi:hypothetical protein